jgi:hypothetical protein
MDSDDIIEEKPKITRNRPTGMKYKTVKMSPEELAIKKKEWNKKHYESKKSKLKALEEEIKILKEK